MKCGEFISVLLETRDNAHLAHWRTKSYAEHVALDEFYSNLLDLVDRYVEKHQGAYGEIIEEIPQITLKEELMMVPYLMSKLKAIKTYRESVDRSELQQIIDDIIEVFDGAIYKLKFLS